MSQTVRWISAERFVRHPVGPFTVDRVQSVHRLHPIPNWTGYWTSRNCSIGSTTITTSSEWSARNGSTCPAPSTIRSGCGKKWSAQLKCADASSTARTWSRCALVSKTEGTVIASFPRQRDKLVTEVTSEVWKRDEQVHDLRRRTESSSTTVGKRYATTIKTNLTKKLEAKIESQKTKIQSLQRDLQSSQGLSEQLGQSELQFDSKCLCWWKCWCIDIIRKPNLQNQQPLTQHKLEATLSCFNLDQSQSLIMEDPKKREADAFLDKWLQPTEYRSWIISFNNEVSHSSQHPRATMLWIGQVEGAESVGDPSTLAFTTGRPIPDFENLDFKIASGLTKILKNFKKQITTAERKAQSEKRSLTGRQIACMICDFHNEAIWDFRDLSKVQLNNDNVQPFNSKWDEALSAVTDRPTDNKLESLYKMQVEKSKELTYLLQVYTQETSFGDKKYDYCRLKLMSQRHLEQKINDSHFTARNLDEDRPAIGAPSKGKAKGKGN